MKRHFLPTVRCDLGKETFGKESKIGRGHRVSWSCHQNCWWVLFHCSDYESWRRSVPVCQVPIEALWSLLLAFLSRLHFVDKWAPKMTTVMKENNVSTLHSKEEFVRERFILRANRIPRVSCMHSSKPTLCANSFLSFSAFDNSLLSVSFLVCNSPFSFSRCFESSCCLRSVLRSSETKELKSVTR